MSDKLSWLQLANASLKKQITELRLEIAKLQRRNAKLEALNFSSAERVKALEKLRPSAARAPTDTLDTARRIAFVLQSAGMRIVDSSGADIKPTPAPQRQRK